ncbi:MAG: hypothetical protein IT384_17500 [Deltaproteobacteria bacterium]|nr:hypothetical protein [Deltaproteobacteria bacterium]
MRIERREFSHQLSRHHSLDLARPTPALQRALSDIGVRPEDLRDVAGGDHVIRGQAEFEALYDRLAALDRTRPAQRGDLDRATRLYNLLVAPDAGRRAEPGRADAPGGVGISGARRRGAGVADADAPARGDAAPDARPAQPANDAPVPVRTVATPHPQRVGSGRDAHNVDTFVQIPAEVDQRVAALRDLPPAPARRGADRHHPVSAYLAAVDAYEARAELRAAGRHGRSDGAGRPPRGVNGDLWALSRALDLQNISSADVRTYLATGRLPDLRDAAGQVVVSGEDRFAQLERAAVREGSWTAVNSFTFLVGMRRSAMAAERTAMLTQLDALPANDPGRAELSAAIDQSQQIDRQLRSGLHSIYSAATYARERSSQALVARAGRLEAQAATARSANDTARADRLDQQARELRDRGARMAHAEATYRAGMRGTGWSATSVFQIAADAQISRGRAEIATMQRTGQLTDTPPASLGNDDGTRTGNGVPGAGRLLSDARAADPGAARNQRQLALEGSRNDSLAVFHREHLVRGGYFDRTTATSAPAARSPALLGHRQSYVDARATQANLAGQRLQLYGPAAQLSGDDARTAAAVATERRQVLDELGGALAQSMASDRAVTEARGRRDQASQGLRDAQQREGDARRSVQAANEGVERAIDTDSAVFGDTFKTSGEARRDNEGITDARTVQAGETRLLEFATGRREAATATLARTEGDLSRASAQLTRDAQDADIVRRALAAQGGIPGAGGGNDAGYRAVRGETDQAARLGEGYLTRAEQQLPSREPRRTQQALEIAGARVDLAGYWTQSTEVNAMARGDAGRGDATQRLDTASGLLDRADTTRAGLAQAHPGRVALAAGIVDARAALAEANADYRPGVSRTQLDRAETLADADLAGHPDVLTAARGRIGSAAVTSLLRHDARFDQVLHSGGHEPTADDALYRQAHRLLDGDRAGRSAQVAQARTQLGEIDRSLNAVSDILSASGDQLRNGQAYAEAQTRAMGRSEIAAAQVQVSSVISGGAFLLSFGQFDMKDQMADAGEGATRMRINSGRRFTNSQLHGQEQLSAAWTRARSEGRGFEFLGSMRIFADRTNRDRVPGAYNAAFGFIQSRVPDARTSGAMDDWQDFNRVAIREGGVPVARSLAGPFIGLAQSRDALGDRRLGMVTTDMQDLMLQSQADSLRQTTENMGWIVAANVGLEVALGIVATGGVGSVAAVGEGANALNAGRTGLQAMQAARTVGTVARATEALSVFRAAHPVLHTIGVSATVGAGMMGASWGARRLFGASSGMSRGVDVAANFIPIGAAHRAAGLGSAADRALIRGGEGVATAERAVGRMGALRQAVSAERLLAHARFYGPQVALGGGQAFVATLATPVLADRLGIRSEAGQAALGLALNTVMSAGVAAGVARRGSARADAITAHLTEGARLDRAATGRVRTEVEGFLRRTEGRVPTEADAQSFRRAMHDRLGIREGGDPAMADRRAQVDSMIEAIRIDRAGEHGVRDARGRSTGPLTEAQAQRAVEVTAEQLFQARGGDRGGASRAQAYRDAVQVVTQRLGEGAPEGLMASHRAAVDRARAGEIASSFAVAPENGRPLITSPEQRGRVETVIASEIGPMRRALETGEGPGLTDRSRGASAFERMSQRLQREGGLTREGAESVLRAVQHDLVERGVAARLVSEQSRAQGPLSEAQINQIARDVAERAGVERGPAGEIARDLVSRAGFVDWVRSQLPQSLWSADMHRQHFLATAHADTRAELGNFTTAEMRAMYPDGPIPRALDRVGRIPGFGQYARQHPAEARRLADAVALMPSFDATIRAHGFQVADQMARALMPTVSAHPTDSRYLVARRGPSSPNFVPEVNLRPRPELDHNGAFQQDARVPGRVSGDRRAPTPNPDLGVMHPSQLVVNGQPLTSMDGVLVFSGHGGRTGFSGLRTPQAAAMVADQIVAAHQQGRQINYVVLDACHQRDRRFFFGDSNSQAFQRELSQRLAQHGLSATVLAADRGGPTYGSAQRSYLPIHRDANGSLRLGYGFEHARYTEASNGGRFYVSQMEAALGLMFAGEAAAGYFVYRALSDRDQDRRDPQENRQPDRRPAASPR